MMSPKSVGATYSTIMVPVDLASGCERRLGWANSLADRFESALIGVSAQSFMSSTYLDGVLGLDVSIAETEKRGATEAMTNAESKFREAVGNRKSVEWRHSLSPPAEFLIAQARAADLVVVSQTSTEESSDPMIADPRDLAMELGRPMLLLPPTGDYLTAKRIVIAWKDSREARRAVWDSLPLLRKADEVFVVTIGRESGAGTVADIVEFLARHQIVCRAVARDCDEGSSVAEALTSVTMELGADLIVCGAYGHSRLREWVLGGVTADLMDNAQHACLMSN